MDRLECSGEILGVSGVDRLFALFEKERSQLTEVAFPSVDLQNLPFDDDSFDWVLTDQVIEHVPNPQLAIDESHRVVRSGGHVIHTTCMTNPVHYGPQDYWRFTPDGLAYLCRNFSEIIQCEGWGNRLAQILLLVRPRFRFKEIPESLPSIWRRIATWNQRNYAIHTWVIARK